MKKRGSDCEFKSARLRDLKRAFYDRLGREGISTQIVYEELAEAPAERFYISESRAYDMLNHKWKHGRWPGDISPNRRCMIEEIERRVLARRALHPEESRMDAIFEVVNSPAPSFYLSPGSIRVYLSGVTSGSSPRGRTRRG